MERCRAQRQHSGPKNKLLPVAAMAAKAGPGRHQDVLLLCVGVYRKTSPPGARRPSMQTAWSTRSQGRESRANRGRSCHGEAPAAGKGPTPPAAEKGTMAAKGGSTSSEEEPESSVSATSEEDDPLRGEPNWRQLCRRIVRSCYRGQWANLVFDKTGKRLHVEEDAPEKGKFSFGSTPPRPRR